MSVTLAQAVASASRNGAPLPLARKDAVAVQAHMVALPDMSAWPDRDLYGLAVTAPVLDELVRRDVHGSVLCKLLGDDLRNLGEGFTDLVMKKLTAGQTAWMIRNGPQQVLVAIVACHDRRPLTDRIAATVQLAQRCQAPLHVVERALKHLGNARQDALDRIDRDDVLRSAALGPTDHPWRPHLAERLLRRGLIPALDDAVAGGEQVGVTPVRRFVEKAALTVDLLDELAAHPALPARARPGIARRREQVLQIRTMRAEELRGAVADLQRRTKAVEQALSMARAAQLVKEVMAIVDTAGGLTEVVLMLSNLGEAATLEDVPAVMSGILHS